MNNIINILINYGLFGIIIVAFSEAIFLPVPMEFISIPIYLLNPTKAFLYSIILVLFSALGSIVGYYLGKFLGKPIMKKFISDENLTKLKNLYDKNSFLTILSSSFTPIPYEAYVLSAGMFTIDFRKFIFPAIISRIIRHLPQGIIISLYGRTLLSHLKNYTLVISLFIFTILLLKYLLSKSNRNSTESSKSS